MIRLFLVDDHPVVREGIRAFLMQEPGLLVVGEAGHGQALLEQLPTTPTDVVLLDINMPVLGGLATTRRLRAEFPGVKILMLSMLNHERYVGQLFEAGALGYILKNDDPAEIVLAIRTVAAGQAYLCSELSLQLLHLSQAQEPAVAPPTLPVPNPYQLSQRELEVLELLADGLTNADIATRLHTSKRTIETHRQHLLDKTQSRNVAVLIRLAVAQGLLR